MKTAFNINDHKYEVDLNEDMPLLWVLRDKLNLTGTKFGCGIGLCGVCMVLLDGEALQSCQISAKSVSGKKIVTIEGLSSEQLNKVQQAWIEEQVPQCGYCQPGQIITATALLNKYTHPSHEQINKYMSRVLCRCGTYPRIDRAIQKLINQSN